MFIFIPVPLFYDFGRLSFFYISFDDYDYLVNTPIIPMPIGGIAFFISLIIGYICSIVYSNMFKSVLSPAKTLLFYLLVVLPLILYYVFVSGLSAPRLIQLMLPVFFISLMSLPVNLKDRMDVFKIVFLSGFVFFNLHFLSIFLESESLLNIQSNYEFSRFFGMLIYQSLVTYPATLSLYFILTIAIIYVARKEISPKLINYKYLAYYFVFILLYLLAASGRRAFLIEFTASFTIILCSSLMLGISYRFVKKKSIGYLMLFVFAFFAFFALYINIPLSDRVLVSVEEDSFDSGRLYILGLAYDFFSSNPKVLFFGGGPKETPGFHNYILDQIYRVGIVGLISVYTILILLIKRFVKVNDLGSHYKSHRLVFILITFSSLFLQSLINASVSQPYYLVNFLVVIILIFFVLFTPESSEYKS